MKKVELKVRQGFSKGAISPRLFGSFVEHMGSVVYNGIFEPGHPTADKNGFRQDVLSYVKELSLGVIRYPGGNFTSGYDWQDTIGPVTERPKKSILHGKESNQIHSGYMNFSNG